LLDGKKEKIHVLFSCYKATFYWKNGNQCAWQPVSYHNYIVALFTECGE
jgi:hypothetical protein